MFIGIGMGVGVGNGKNTAPTVLLSDSFNRANNASSMGNAETGQTWSVVGTATWGILSGAAYNSSLSGSGIATAEFGKADYDMSMVVNGQHTGTGGGYYYLQPVFRMLDASNYLRIAIQGSTIQLVKVVTTTATTIASASFSTSNNIDYLIRILCSGNNVTVWVNGVLYLTYTLSGDEVVFSTYTKGGMRLFQTGTPVTTAFSDRIIVEGL